MLNLHMIPWHDKLLKKSYFTNHNTIYIERILFKKVPIHSSTKKSSDQCSKAHELDQYPKT